MVRSLVFIFVVVALCAARSRAFDIHVSSATGDDSIPVSDGGGSEATPFRGFDHALSVCTNTSSMITCNVILQEGSYNISRRHTIQKSSFSMQGAGDRTFSAMHRKPPLTLITGSAITVVGDARITVRSAAAEFDSITFLLAPAYFLNVMACYPEDAWCLSSSTGKSGIDSQSDVDGVDSVLLYSKFAHFKMTATAASGRYDQSYRRLSVNGQGASFSDWAMEGCSALIDVNGDVSLHEARFQDASVSIEADSLVVRNSTFSGHPSAQLSWCSALSLRCHRTVITDSVFQDLQSKDSCNRAAMDLSLESTTSVVHVERCSFLRNRGGTGGAVTLYTSNVGDNYGCGEHDLQYEARFSNCRFENNHALYDGGAIYAERINYLVVNESVFESNTAQRSGAAISSPGTYGLVANCEFNDNHGYGSCPLFSGASSRYDYVVQDLLLEAVLVDGEAIDEAPCTYSPCCVECYSSHWLFHVVSPIVIVLVFLGVISALGFALFWCHRTARKPGSAIDCEMVERDAQDSLDSDEPY